MANDIVDKFSNQKWQDSIVENASLKLYIKIKLGVRILVFYYTDA